MLSPLIRFKIFSFGGMAMEKFRNKLGLLVVCLVLVLSTGAVKAALIGQWHMDDGSGSVITDSSGNGSDLTKGAGYSWSTGYTGGGLTNSTAGEYSSGSIAAALRPTTQLTMSAWIKPSGLNASEDTRIVGIENAATLSVTYWGTLRLQCRVTDLGNNGGWPLIDYENADDILLDGNWHKVTGIFDGELNPGGAYHMYLYIDDVLVNGSWAAMSPDGNPVGFSSHSVPDTGAGTNVVIGGNPWNPSVNSYMGAIDEVAIYNSVFIPEPATMTLLAVGALALIRRRIA